VWGGHDEKKSCDSCGEVQGELTDNLRWSK